MAGNRRDRGDGAIFFDKSRNRWVARIDLGPDPVTGKPRRPKRTAMTKTQAKQKLKELQQEFADRLPTESSDYTVADAVADWLKSGLRGRSRGTLKTYRHLIKNHIVPDLGSCPLTALTVDDVDDWLDDKAQLLSTETLGMIRSILKRAVTHAQKRDKVRRNVVLLCDVPDGKATGRPSKALTLDQAEEVLDAARRSRLYAYITLALLTGARTEELRAMTWDHVHLDAEVPHVAVWRSTREGGDTKTKRSRRTIALPKLCVAALRWQRIHQDCERIAAGARWKEHNLVFASMVGTEMSDSNVRVSFRRVLARTSLVPGDWTPRELRHSFVSLMSDDGVPVERIALVVGHSGTSVTERVYRHQLRPVITDGAEAMDSIFRL